MLGCCDSTSAFLDRVCDIDEVEKRALTINDVPPLERTASGLDPVVQAADELELAFQHEIKLARTEQRPTSLRRAVLREYWYELTVSTAYRFIYEAMNLIAPFVLRYLVEFMGRKDDEVESHADRGHGYGLAIAFSLVTLVLLISLAWSTSVALSGLSRLSTAMMLVLQRKLMKLPGAAVAAISGKAQTLIVTETQTLLLNSFIGSVLANPFALVANILVLWYLAGGWLDGWPGLLGGLVLVLFAGIQAMLTTSSRGFRSKYLNWAEIRVRRVTQAISAVKMIKVFGWEGEMQRVIESVRAIEVDSLVRLVGVRTLIIALSHAVPQLSQLVVFGTLYAVNGAQSRAVLFPIIILLNSARITTASFSLNLSRASDALTSIDRWQEFLEQPERSSYVEHKQITMTTAGHRTAAVDGDGGSNDDDDEKFALVMREPCTFGVVTSPAMYKEMKKFASSVVPPASSTAATSGNNHNTTATGGSSSSDAAKEEKNKKTMSNNAQQHQSNEEEEQQLPEGAIPLGDGTTDFFMPILQQPVSMKPLKRNTLTIVGGAVASGKSILLSGLIGVGDLPPSLTRRQLNNNSHSSNNTSDRNHTAPQSASEEMTTMPTNTTTARAAASSSSSSSSSFSSPIVHNSDGSVIVCASEPWILNSTLRENIIMTLSSKPQAPPNYSRMDVAKYARALFVSGLVVDLASLPCGDLTEVGAGGLNMSGGQKARCQLARAVYAATPGSIVFLEDSTLSAVDPSLVQSLFLDCIKGALCNTTRVLVTHERQLFEHADRIIEMANRRVAFDGTPSEFAAFEKEREEQQKIQQQHHTTTSSSSASSSTATTGKTAAGSRSSHHVDTLDELGKHDDDEEENDGSNNNGSGNNEGVTSPRKAATAPALFEKEDEFVEHVKSVFASAAGFSAFIDGKKPRLKTAQGGNQEEEETYDGKLSIDAKSIVGGTRWSTFTYYAERGGICLGLTVLIGYIMWRASISASDMALALWTTSSELNNNNNTSLSSSALLNINATNSTSSTGAAAAAARFTSEQFFGFFGITIAVSIIAIVVRTWAYVKWTTTASVQMHSRLFSKIMRAPMSWHDTTRIAEPLARLSKDTEACDVHFAEEFFFCLAIMMTTLGLLVSILIASLYLIPFFAILLVVYESTRRRFGTGLRCVRRLQDTTRVPVIGALLESLNGMKCGAIQSARLEAKFLARFTEAVSALAATYGIFTDVQHWLLLRMAHIGFVLVLLMALSAITVRIVPALSAAIVDTSFLNLGLAYSSSLSLNLSYATSTLASVLVMMSAIERISSYENLPEEPDCEYASSSSVSQLSTSNEPTATTTTAVPVFDGTGAQDEDEEADENRRSPSTKRIVAPLPPDFPADGSLEFRNVSMRYRPQLPLVLRHVSFKVSSGEKIGVCGRSGSAKSSLFVALFRLVEIEREGGGVISLAGRDIRDIKLRQLRTMISTIPQDASSSVFAGTVRSNLSPWTSEENGDEEQQQPRQQKHTDAELEHVLELVGLKNRIFKKTTPTTAAAESSSFPSISENSSSAASDASSAAGADGLSTVVEGGGANFSSGERQLLVLARALLRRAKFIMLDEATSNADAATDEHMQQLLSTRPEFDGVTFLIIAHRVSTLMHCNKILTMKQGEAVEFDSPATLLRNERSEFYKMVSKLGPARLAELTKLAITYEEQRKRYYSL